MGSDRRSSRRAKVGIPVLFAVAGQSGTFAGTTHNANGDCALVETATAAPVGATIDLKFMVATDDPYAPDLGLDLRATVTRLEHSPDGKINGMVIRFHRTEALDQQITLPRPA
jgi:hypothetical protein